MNKDKMELEEILKMYNELKRNKEVIDSIDVNFFFKFVEILLQELDNSVPKKKIKDNIKKTSNMIDEYVKKKDETNNFMNFYSNEILKLNGKLFGYKELLEDK